MSEALKLGDVVRYKLTNELMTVISDGPVNVGGVIGVSGGYAVQPRLSNDHVLSKYFEGTELKRKTLKKSDIEFVRSGVLYEAKEGDVVELASGGPRMVVNRCGPKSFGLAVSGIMGHAHRSESSVRHDLIGCKWKQPKREKSGEFEIGTLRLIE